MKRLLLLLLVLTMLVGCGPHTPPAETTLPAESTAAPTEVPTTAPEQTLLDQAKPWLGDENLLELPLSQLQADEYYDIAVLPGERLLLTRNLIRVPENPDDGGEYEGGYEIIGMEYLVVDLRTGDTAAQLQVDTPNYVPARILDDEIVLCDAIAGTVRIYDCDLQLLRGYDLEPDYGEWYLGRRNGAEVIYRFTPDHGCVAENPATGEQETVIRRHPGLWPDGIHSDELFVTEVDDAGMTKPITLDLHTGEKTPMPFPEQAMQTDRVGDTWLGFRYLSTGDYLLCRNGETQVVPMTEKSLRLLPDGKLLESDLIRLRLYDGEGRFLDECRVAESEEDGWLYSVLDGSGLGGCLLVVEGNMGQRHVLLWQPETEPQAEGGLAMYPYEPKGRPERGTAVSESLYERAEQIGDRFGVDVLIADQCDTADVSYTVEYLDDEELIGSALDVLEKSMETYPEGFFRQFKWNYINRMQIQITGYIYPGETHTIGGGYSAYAHQRENICMVVVDAHSIHDFVLAHEFSHLIDRKLQWDADSREDSDYSEEKWLSLNPEGFEYLNDYENYESYFDYGDPMQKYFWTPYATVNATEDRATMIECAVGIPWAYDDAPGMQAKLRYYCDCIRDCFDTTGWPEYTVWEKVMLEWTEAAA